MFLRLFLAAAALTGGELFARADPPHAEANMIRPGQEWLDTSKQPIDAHGGGILFHGGAYYWFGEDYGPHSRRGVRVYRSSDLANWEDRGRALEVSNVPRDPLEAGCVIERPKVLYCAKTGKFVMWFHHELKDQGYAAAHAAVAVADEVTGPYRLVHTGRPDAGSWPMNFRPPQPVLSTRPSTVPSDLPSGLEVKTIDPGEPRYKRLMDGYVNGQESRDMTVFRDDDGAAYVIYSSEMNGTLHISQLTGDYLGYAGRWVRVFPGQNREAPVMFKSKGHYYLITSACTGWKPNAADAAVADSIWGPWKSLGNPWQGSPERTKVSYDSQGAFALPIAGTPNVLFMADRWKPRALENSRYIWTPVEWAGQKPVLRWHDSWDVRELWHPRPTSAATRDQ